MKSIFLSSILCFIFKLSSMNSINKLSVSIYENVPLNVSVVNLRPEIEKSQKDFKYELLMGLSQNKYFYVNKNYDLIVLTNIDRDRNPDLCKEMTTEFLCVWTGVIMFEGYNVIISLRIEIKDVNDNIPFWNHPILIEIMENNPPGKTIDLTQAQDDDSPPNNVQRYELMSNKYSSIFRLTKEPGPSGIIPRLTILTVLDHEKYKEFSLTLNAFDGAYPYHSGSVNISIKILDQNDNAPKFEKSHFSLTIPENYPLFKPLMLNLTAVDDDSGQFGSVIYYISESSPPDSLKKFSINNHGIITVIRNIDYDIGEKLFTFIVVAKDQGNPPLSSLAMVKITIKDVNDQPPTILINSYSTSGSKNNPSVLSIVENNSIGQAVARISATDSDSFESDFCNCTLTHFSDFQLVFERNVAKMTIYRLIANKVFDRETRSIIKVTVICSDTGYPPMTSSETLRIIVEDVNDNNPIFDKNVYSYVVAEENAPNTIIAKLRATDDDAGKNGKLTYNISPNSKFRDPRPAIKVNENGEIIAVQPLDRESNLQGYKFQIIAIDQGDNPRSGTTIVVIHLNDINDCKPKFSDDSYFFQLEEDSGISSIFRPKIVGSIKVTDADIGKNGISSFEILPKNSPFKIDENKYIKTTRFIDREHRKNYMLTVLAVDGLADSEIRHTTSTVVNITVTDVNDNAPQFYIPKNLSIPINVSLYEEPGFVFTNLQATDSDEGENARVTYHISGGNIFGLFEIESQTGRLSVRDHIQSKLKVPFTVTILARDHGTPSLSSTVVIRILLTDTPAIGTEINKLNNRTASSTQTNQILIMIIVTITCVICIGLITIICLMARGIVFRQRYCKTLSEKQMSMDERASTMRSHGYYPAMMTMGDNDYDTMSHYRHSLLDNPYCTLQMAALNYNNNINSVCYGEKQSKDRFFPTSKLMTDQQNGSDSDSGHGNSMNNNSMPCDSKDNLVYTSFSTFTSTPTPYSPVSSFPKSSNSPPIPFAKVPDNVPSIFVKYST